LSETNQLGRIGDKPTRRDLHPLKGAKSVFGYSWLPVKLSTAKKRVVIASTSHNVLGVTGWPTGVWVLEVAHPLHELVSADIRLKLIL